MNGRKPFFFNHRQLENKSGGKQETESKLELWNQMDKEGKLGRELEEWRKNWDGSRNRWIEWFTKDRESNIYMYKAMWNGGEPIESEIIICIDSHTCSNDTNPPAGVLFNMWKYIWKI